MIIDDILNGAINRIKKIKDKNYKIQSLKRYDSLRDYLDYKFLELINLFPKKNTNKFYLELLDLYIPIEKVFEAKRRLIFIRKKINEFYRNYKLKVKVYKNKEDIRRLNKEFYGRVFSLLKRNKKYFNIVETIKEFYRNMPRIKDLPTVVITGLPNVGKSTLLKKLTGSEPEISNYPFTTKDIMIGYIKTPYSDIQVLDVPGILDREITKMNEIEKRAILALKYLANIIVFVIDVTETCGYKIEEQENVLRRILKLFKAKTYLYFSKADLFSEKERKIFEEISKKYNIQCYKDFENLKEEIINFIKQNKIFK
ncbi:MAG: GTPase [Nanopusillaceae archaeon]